MNPLVSAFAGAAVRWIITAAAAQGVVVSDNQATQVISGLVALGTLAWSFYQKHRTSQRIETARQTGL